MSIILKYVHIKRQDKTLWRAPIIPIFVHDKDGKLLIINALVDSGADNTVVPKALAELLGLKEEDQLETGGIGGKVTVKKSKMSITIKGIRESYSFVIPVLVLQDAENSVPLLLGRNGFFEHFHITFKQDEEKIILKKINKN